SRANFFNQRIEPVADKTLTLDQFKTLRKDNWWVEPMLVVAVLGGFAIYATWANKELPLIGSWWNISPAFLILWIPGGFRATCYYYRKAYYRSFFLSPPACAV